MYYLALNPFEKRADFHLSDFYMSSAARRAEVRLSKDIVIVPVDYYSRTDIINTVKEVSHNNPSAIMLDIFMDSRQEGDEELIEILNSCPNLILPTSLSGMSEQSLYGNIASSYTGYAELYTGLEGTSVRRFMAVSPDGAVSMAGRAAKLKRDIELPKDDPLINFAGVQFEEIFRDELHDYPELVQDKIVIVANVKDFGDVHKTSLGYLSGAYIQAYITQTLLDGSAPKEVPKVVIIIVAFVLCFVWMWIHSLFNDEVGGGYSNMVFRIAQIVVILLIYYAGSWLFIEEERYADLSLILLLVSAAALIFDFVDGISDIRQYREK